MIAYRVNGGKSTINNGTQIEEETYNNNNRDYDDKRSFNIKDNELSEKLLYFYR